MDWSSVTPDELDRGFDRFAGLEAAVTAELCSLIRAADVSQVWMADGTRSLVEWVGLRLRVRPGTARRLVGVSRRLAGLPVLSARFSCGDLSLDQVEALSRMVTPETEEAVIEQTSGLSSSDLDRAARRSRPPCGDTEGLVWERRRLVRQWNLDVSELRFWGCLPAEQGQVLDTAIDARAALVPVNPETGMLDGLETRSADALVELAATTSTGDTTPPQISVHVDYEALTTHSPGVAELASGALIANETARRLACDGTVEAVIRGDNQVVGVGSNRRTVPGWLRRPGRWGLVKIFV